MSARLLLALFAFTSTVAAYELQNDKVASTFDSSGRLTTLSSISKKPISTHDLSGDGWAIEVGDLPFPTGATVFKNKQVLSNASCPTLPAPPAMTTVDQCAFHCMATEGCEAWTANFDTWVTWGRPRLDCRLHTCPGPFGDVLASANTTAGVKPPTKSVQLSSESCSHIAVTQPSESSLQTLHSNCQGFKVNVTYELAAGWHFVTKHLSICQEATTGHCDPTAGFTVRHVIMWPGLQLHKGMSLGAMAMNPYSRKALYGEAMSKGSGETASFWRAQDGTSTGLFASVQTSFFESGEGFGAFRWGSNNARWGYINYGSWQMGAAITDKTNFHPAATADTLNIIGKSSKGGNDVALLLASPEDLNRTAATKGEGDLVARLEDVHEATTVAVTMVQGQATNEPAPSPLKDGFAGVVFGAAGSAATATAPASVEGFAAVVTLFEGKQVARFLKLSGPVEHADSSGTVLKETPINISSTEPVRIAVHSPAERDGSTTLSLDGIVVLEMVLPPQTTPGTGVGLIILQQDASFVNFTSSAAGVLGVGPLVQPDVALVQGRYSPMMKQVASLGAWHQADAGVLGFTELTGYEMPESGVDLGEAHAFTTCVEHFLMDQEMRKSGAVRYQVAWDSNEYQLDMSRAADREEYTRLIHRNAELGLKYMVYEPRNTAVSSRWDHTDEWWWEEVLWFQLGIGIRNGTWAPHRDKLPPTVAEMMQVFQSEGVQPAAYVYPTLAWRGEGEDEWLYESPQREAGDGKRASLASPKLQDYLIDTMVTFMNVTGGAGFAWDYGIQGDTRVPNLYQEVRGWLRILAALRKAKPDMVMDHRQIAHSFGPWYHLAGSYSEPIAGDENPESYGAELASLSTDHILADNLRMTNYRYRLQLLPNDRVPGFMFHQTERHFNNGNGDDTGRPGDKIDSNGNPLWKPDILPDPHTGNYSGITYGNCVVKQDWHTRDFDYLGYRYSVISTLGTAGRNLVVANVPGRDIEEYNAFPKEDIAWIRKWFAWADQEGSALRRTIPLLGYEYPRLGQVDGTAAVSNNSGFLFLFNPAPDGASAVLHLDQSMGLTPGLTERWLISEIYPREEGLPLGVWGWGDSVAFDVRGGTARILKLEKWEGALAETPVAFNVSSESVRIVWGTTEGTVVISGASELTGSTTAMAVHVPSQQPLKLASKIIVNGQSFPTISGECIQPGARCMKASLTFTGSSSLRTNARAAVTQQTKAGTYATSITVSSAMSAQLKDRQQRYNVAWLPEDLDASWLAPSRLLLYIYIVRPSPSLPTPVVLVDGKAVPVTRQYNSRGNHAIVPAGGGAVSGNTAKTFLGWYIDCSLLRPDVQHHLSIDLSWTEVQRKMHPFLGIYWHNVEDAMSSEVLPGVENLVGPL